MSSKKLNKSVNKEGQSLQIRQKVHYSETFKRQKVKELVAKQLKVSELCRLYGLSRTSVYNWLYKYSPHHDQGSIQVVQMESEAHKTKNLQSQVVELEAALGRKQLELDYLDKLLELAGKELGYDLKKNFAAKVSNGFDTIKSSMIID